MGMIWNPIKYEIEKIIVCRFDGETNYYDAFENEAEKAAENKHLDKINTEYKRAIEEARNLQVYKFWQYNRVIETSRGTFYVKGCDVFFIGRTETGFWWWIVRLLDRDRNRPNEWYDSLLFNDDYTDLGGSSAGFDTLEDCCKNCFGTFD